MALFRKLLLTAALAVSSVSASAYSGITIFGDSLSDTGNVFAATGFSFPPPPYFAGRFSNGPVWVETLASGMGFGAQSTASFLGGNNYAFGGARMNGTSPVPGLLQQMGGLWAPTHPAADPNALYVVVGGGNDMRDARAAFATASAADQAGRQGAAQAAVDNLIAGLGFLASRGAKEVLISNLPDLGGTPEAVGLGLQYASSDATQRFNALMGTVLAAGASFGLNMHFLDMADVLADVLDDAQNNGGAQYGITNVFTPCGAFQGSIGISCDVSAFSDALHPTARAHQLLGQAALRAIPEPQTLALMVLCLGMLALRARRQA